MSFAKKYVLEHGPIILEMDTYRYHGHSMSDPGSTYRTRDEISSMRQLRDPVEHVRKLLLEKANVDPAELKKIEKVCFCLKFAYLPMSGQHCFDTTGRFCVHHQLRIVPSSPISDVVWRIYASLMSRYESGSLVSSCQVSDLLSGHACRQ